MLKKKYFLAVILTCASLCLAGSSSSKKLRNVRENNSQELHDVTVVGYLRFFNGLGRNAIAALDYLQDSLKMNFVQTPRFTDLQDCPNNVLKVLETNDPEAPSNVAVLYDTLDILKNKKTKFPNSTIKIAYTMIEATAVFEEWADRINKDFDAIVVPDIFLEEVYRSSGVKKPIFTLPHPIYIDEFLAKPIKEKPNKPFEFGLSCVLTANKNYINLVDAFIAEFGNSQDVILKIQCPQENEHTKLLREKIQSMKITNIFLNFAVLPWREYIEFMSSLDCYCLLSKGEGFSVTPREALALGTPCIISNMTAHKTICNADVVCSVDANILEPHVNGKRVCGYNFNCKVEDVRSALRAVYYNYDHYLEKAHRGREWVKQYQGPRLKKKYLNLFKPKTIILGNRNEITDDYLMTTDEELYNKYKKIMGKNTKE